MSLKGISKETLTILDSGHYHTAEGNRIDIAASQEAAMKGTRLLTPDELAELFTKRSAKQSHISAAMRVSGDKTQEAARRMVQDEGIDDLLVLNFASARNVGGGFLRGAKAQEEDLARSSGLFRCLETQRAYYEINRACSSLLYTDHMIYSPGVPWFREQNRELLDSFFLASILTAPAPNAGEYLRRAPGEDKEVRKAFGRRSGYVLALAEAFGHRNLLLGAWGCGVFRNRPKDVASAFVNHLKSRRFDGCFDRVEFAVYDRSESKSNLQAFATRVSGQTIYSHRHGYMGEESQ